jgi:hypothetical protein
VAVEGIGRAVEMMVHRHAAAGDAGVLVPLIVAVGQAHAALGAAVLAGAAEGWPEGRAPTLTAAQRSELGAVAAATPALAEGFAALAERWGEPELFGAGVGGGARR